MALKDNASLALIPAAYKTSKIYSAIPTDGDGDFTFTRSGNATRINKAGLVETMGTNIGRLNYDLTNGTPASCPSLLLEPSRTNKLGYSQDFTNWQDTGVTVTANDITAPDGTITADKLVSSANNWRRSKNFTAVSGTTYTYSIFAKLDTTTTTTTTQVEIFRGASGIAVDFDLINKSTSGSGLTDTFIEEYPNDWYRIGGTYTANGTTNIIYVYPSAGYSQSGTMYFWGAQVEVGSHKTSYIPTAGVAAVTRTVDVTNNVDGVTVNSDFTYFVHIKNFDDKTLGNFPVQFFLRESASPFSYLRFLLEGNERFYAQLRNNNTATTVFNQFSDTLSNLGDDIKLAFAKSGTNCKYYVNGSLVLSSTITDFNYSFNRINHSTGNDQPTKLSQLMVFNEALSDSELQTLTS